MQAFPLDWVASASHGQVFSLVGATPDPELLYERASAVSQLRLESRARSHRKPSSHCSRALWTLTQAQTLFDLSSHAQSRLPTALLLVSAVLWTARGADLPCVGPQDWGIQFVAFTTLSPEQVYIHPSPLHVISLFLWVPSQGHRSWPNHFLPLLPNCLCIFLIALVVQVSFCQFPVGFQREFFHMYMYFWCVHGWRWDPLSFTLPTWAKPSTCVFWWMDKENVIDIMKY